MQNSFKICLILITIFLYNCKTSKKTDAENKNEQNNYVEKISETRMKEEGYVRGLLKSNTSKDCPYILTVEAYEDVMDPINLRDFFKVDIPEKVWVKYSSLRMKNRCTEARPISIIAIEKRVD